MIGIVVALNSEANEFIDSIENAKECVALGKRLITGKISGEEIALTICGIGKVNAALATQYLIDRFSLKSIINFGTAGGLKPEIKVADVYVIKKCAQYDFDLSELDPVPRGYIQDYDTVFFDTKTDKLDFLPKAILASGDRFSDSPVDYDEIIKMGANVKDMEGGAIGQVCKANNIPLYVIKGITDVYGLNSTAEQFKNNLVAVCKKFPSVVKKVLDLVK